ncbi:hypothetical protein FC96_GL001867 [Secundilactobacillus kimchicus JCM 15530]|uniref:Uncharacterized protein n=2 Tax=Secundilactobacillus kimchicus TaxID=528209 RepID=A0A0R1HYY7_9LACO|nr:hypothetical protein FC96_GL001867 [Secundilactobacillus kimchicus JCM 15530]
MTKRFSFSILHDAFLFSKEIKGVFKMLTDIDVRLIKSKTVKIADLANEAMALAKLMKEPLLVHCREANVDLNQLSADELKARIYKFGDVLYNLSQIMPVFRELGLKIEDNSAQIGSFFEDDEVND